MIPNFSSALEDFWSEPERALLLLLSRPRLDAESSKSLNTLLEQDIFWDGVLRLSAHHWTVPMVARHLRDLRPASAPRPLLDDFEARLQKHLRKAFEMAAELIRILDALESAGIPAVPYKGPELGCTVYGNLALRQFFDLDILCAKKDVDRAKEILLAQGYRDYWQLSPARKRATMRSQVHHQLIREDPACVTELHWGILPANLRDPFDAQALLERSERIRLGGSWIRTLCREDLLLVLCVHCCKHLGYRLVWFLDIAELVRSQQGMDWEGVLRRAKTMGIERMTLLCLLLSRRLLAAPVPEAVLQRAQGNPAVLRLAGDFLRRYLRVTPDQVGSAEKLGVRLRLRERWSDKLHGAMRTLLIFSVPTAKEWERFNLPDNVFFLYYLLRPLRLAGKYAKGFLANVSGAARKAWVRCAGEVSDSAGC